MLAQTRKKLEAGQDVRVGIMGGTFDPIHYGHLVAAHAAMEQLGLEEVVFLPTGTPAFKLDREITPGDVRFSMCYAATSDVDEFSVNAMEITRGGITYTAETLRQLSKMKHPHMHFVFIMGADSASTLLRWRDQETLRSLASYAIVTRAGQKVAPETLEALRGAGYSLEVVESQTPLVSSTDIRARVLAGEDISRLVPPGVERVIREKQLYLPKPEGIDDPLSDEFFEARKADLQQRVSKHRFQHCLGVAEMCVRLAQEYGVDSCCVCNFDPAADLDMVLYIADAIEPNRVYPEVDELRAKIGVVSLEELFFNIYEYWIMRMMGRKMLLHPNTVDVWNHYAGRAALRAKEN